jgi:hypothetical protein
VIERDIEEIPDKMVAGFAIERDAAQHLRAYERLVYHGLLSYGLIRR